MSRRYSLGLCLGAIAPLMLTELSCQPWTRQSPQPQPVVRSMNPGCVSNDNPQRAYFPHKTTLQYAQGFRVEYHRNYKVVTVSNPWRGAQQEFQYLLVQCGTPVPKGYDQAQVIQIPVQRIVVLSTTHLPFLERLGKLEVLTGVGKFDQVNTPAVRAQIDRGELAEFSSGSSLNLEQLLVAAPDLVTTYGTGNSDQDSHPRLIQAGVPVALVGEYMEGSLLGRAEWIKFMALFLNQEAKAESVFAAIAAEYEALTKLTQPIKQRPTVVTGFSRNGTWYMPGRDSYAAQLLEDAGATYLWSDLPGDGSVPLDFEAVFERAKTADIWLNLSQDWQSQNDIKTADPRYGSFAALQTGQVFNNTARLNATGGNDYWESGLANPHLILADLIKLFHPGLLPEHQLVYYRQLAP